MLALLDVRVNSFQFQPAMASFGNFALFKAYLCGMSSPCILRFMVS